MSRIICKKELRVPSARLGGVPLRWGLVGWVFKGDVELYKNILSPAGLEPATYLLKSQSLI